MLKKIAPCAILAPPSGDVLASMTEYWTNCARTHSHDQAFWSTSKTEAMEMEMLANLSNGLKAPSDRADVKP